MLSSVRNVLLMASFSALVAAGGCSDTVTQPTSSPGNPTTEHFSGTLTVNGAVTHQFTATANGSVQATLKDVQPDPTTVIGLALGTWNGTTCQVLLANDQAVVGSGAAGTVSGVGNLCLRIYDVGKLNASVTYSVDVTHP